METKNNSVKNVIGLSKNKMDANIIYANEIYNRGLSYINGIGVEKNEYKAFIHFQKSAEMGYADAINYLGYCYEHSIGVKKDEYNAFSNYQKAAEMGHSTAINNLGNCYEIGIVVKKNTNMAFFYHEKAADMGNSVAINNLGNCYEYGIGIKKDEKMAFTCYKKAADMRNRDAIDNLAHCYSNGIGIEKDEQKAFLILQKSAEMGNANGINLFGGYYLNGIGVKKNECKAVAYFQKSAEMGHANGMNNLGYCYQFGIGVEKDEIKAFNCYQKASEVGSIVGIENLANCYRNGIGISIDLKKADFLYQAAQEKLPSVSNRYNYDVSDDIRNLLVKNTYPLSWIPYNEFKNVVELGKGGFSTVYYAEWKSQYAERKVALKLIHGSKDYNYNEFTKEMKTLCDLWQENPTFLRCFGMSKHVNSHDYIIVLQHASKGSLRKNLHHIAKMEWKKKLTILLCIASDLKIIHSHELIHRDLHSGNVLQSELHSAYISDLGLIMPVKMETDGIYGVLPYIAPEVLNGEKYTKASDIYSFGVIMWEILYGQPVSFDQGSSLHFQLQICDGLRPHIIEGTSPCYVELMKRCWEKEPEKRPSIAEIYNTFIKWQNDEKFLLELSESDIRTQRIRKENMQTYVEAIYKSQFISYSSDSVRRLLSSSNSELDCVICESMN